jgi:hypothetical protein
MTELDLTATEQDLLFRSFFPLGRVPRYDKINGTIELSTTSTRRFVFDSNYTHRLGKSIELSNSKKFDPNYLGFGFFETLSTIIQEDYSLYAKLFNFFNNVDKQVSKIINSCSQSVIIFSHNSFGERLFPHIHQDHSQQSSTLSVFFKLTNNDTELPSLILCDPLEHTSKAFEQGYTNHKLLLAHERKSLGTEYITINNNDAILFDAYNTPHSFTYTNDIWVTVVYDHVSNINVDTVNKGRYNVCPIQY